MVAATAFLILMGVAPRALAAPRVSSGELVEQAADWNGRRVTYEGEVIGAAMRRGDMTWLHLNDDPYARGQAGSGVPLGGFNSGQAVRIPSRLVNDIASFGAYQQQGDVVRVEGIFLAADPEAGGDMLIAADSLTIVAAGRRVTRPVSKAELIAIAVLALTTTVSYAFLHLRKRFHLSQP